MDAYPGTREADRVQSDREAVGVIARLLRDSGFPTTLREKSTCRGPRLRFLLSLPMSNRTEDEGAEWPAERLN